MKRGERRKVSKRGFEIKHFQMWTWMNVEGLVMEKDLFQGNICRMSLNPRSKGGATEIGIQQKRKEANQRRTRI